MTKQVKCRIREILVHGSEYTYTLKKDGTLVNRLPPAPRRSTRWDDEVPSRGPVARESVVPTTAATAHQSDDGPDSDASFPFEDGTDKI
jgi:hypothetical protein